MQTSRLQSYTDLRVWQQGMELVEIIYHLTDRFPKKEQFGLSSQMQRAAVSIPSNIAEGYTRTHRKEYLQHLAIAQGSLAELETQIEISYRLKYSEKDNYGQAMNMAISLAKQLYTLRTSLTKQSLTPYP